MNESLINHLFLPQYLPSSADDDYLIGKDHQYEYKLLEYINEYFCSIRTTDIAINLPIFPVLIDCISRWSHLQSLQNISVTDIQSTIEQLPSNHFLPLYFHAQNAAILIEIDENNVNQPQISAWQVLLPTDVITSSLMPHFSCFPVTTYSLHDRSELTSRVHCELLRDFMLNTIEYSKVHKCSNELDEIREVPQSHYVCRWWIEQFKNIQIENCFDKSIQFKKKHRDQIRWNQTNLPFRRSGLWMTIKVVLHTVLVKRLEYFGTVVYKLLITHFLTYVIQKISMHTELLVHCIRKIVRRLNKIESYTISNDAKDLSRWIDHTMQEIESKIKRLIPESNWQKTIQNTSKLNQSSLTKDLKLSSSKTHHHACRKLKAYLRNDCNSNNTPIPTKKIKIFEDLTPDNHNDYIPSFDVLTNRLGCTISNALTYMEIWVQLCLEQWINSCSPTINRKNRFEILFHFYEKYQSVALTHYYSKNGPSDSLGYSQFILTSLTIIQLMHKKLCRDQRFNRLQLHTIDIPNLMKLFEYLTLPNRDDMIRAYNLYDYYDEFRDKEYPDLLNDIKSKHAFGVSYAAQSPSMNNDLERIRIEAEKDKEDKIAEVLNAKQKYFQLMKEMDNHTCEPFEIHNPNECHRCKLSCEANKIKVKVFECPIPIEQESALAVMFELQMPVEIRCYRDILWQFINRGQTEPMKKTYEWLTIPTHASKLKPFYTNSIDCKVKLISSTKSISQSHYSRPPSIVLASVEKFLFENTVKVEITPTNPIDFDDEHRILTPQLEHSDYKQLQFAIMNTEFLQNNVITQISDCPSRLKSIQFIEFGSFRSGHRLQWWNLLMLFEMDSLSIAEESVAILIIHSLLQYGPVISDKNTFPNSWCPESHRDLLEDHFVDELITRLDRRLDECESNWQNELVLVVITIITMRILTICNSFKEDKVAQLARKCRRIGERWIDLIRKTTESMSSTTFNQIEKFRIKMIHISVACILTLSTHEDRIKCLLSSDDDVISLLKTAAIVHDNICLKTTQSNMSMFTRNLVRYAERVLVIIQPTAARFLRKTSYKSLNAFVEISWEKAMKTKNDTKIRWKKRTKFAFDGWYDYQCESKCISIDCIKGTLLVNGMTIDYLPEKIIYHELFRRTFRQHIFEVQTGESPNSYITKYSYHNNAKVRYEFQLNDQTNHLIIKEQHLDTNEMFQLIPHTCFEDELPDMFVSNYSHWWNIKTQIIEFRSVYFKDPDFLNNKPYILSLNTKLITMNDTKKMQILINRSSEFFQHLFLRYFNRLDDEPYVYMLSDNAHHTKRITNIHLSRLGIAFQYNGNTQITTSREYSDMCIDEDQWLGTLTGLTSGLLLSPLSNNNSELQHYLYRKIIVPFGNLHSTRIQNDIHQTVTIQRTSLSSKESSHYFVFILNDRLRMLQSTDSPTGWLYLALLHAMTSHSLPDQYTGMTGIERAFQLLNSAGCWSDQPYNFLSLNILAQIALISPKVDYYPKHLTCMQKINWNDNGLPFSLQHFGYYLIAKQLIKTSEQLHFIYSSDLPTKLSESFEEELYNEMLLKKLYWDYRDSYNPMVRLSAEMETDMLRTYPTKTYHLISEDVSHITNYPTSRLVDDLYRKGNVTLKDCSNLHWLPLSQWLTEENGLKNVWIGLLKLVCYSKVQAAKNDTNNVQRLHRLLDFLHYISSKYQINPFYLQMLQTVLNTPTITFSCIEFPRFTEYQNIEETYVIQKRFPFEKRPSADIRNRVKAEVEECLKKNSRYTGSKTSLTNTDEIYWINVLLDSWQLNKSLQHFLQSVQNMICSVPIQCFHSKAAYNAQQFTVELFEHHHQIQLKSSDESLNNELLLKATKKFHHLHTSHFSTQNKSLSIIEQQRNFPNEIFPFINNEENPLQKIDNYFKNQLAESWNTFLSNEQYEEEQPSVHEIEELLNSIQTESTTFWNELITSLKSSNELLFDSGIISRITPSILITILLQKNDQSSSFNLTTNQCTLLGGTLVNWTLEQQIERALHYIYHNKLEDFKKEISNIPHSNWIPSEHISWLILELEMNIIIRNIQIKVAHHMMQKDNSIGKNLVMQMNMGEGKTSVILPMLAVNLSSTDSTLVRIIVLKSLLPTNYLSLRHKLGGLLNRRILPFACRRDRNLTDEQVKQISIRLQQGLQHNDVILTSPEDLLSFDLLTIDKCRRNEFEIARSMLTVQRWMKTYVHDVLDESDEILHVKYQLIYTVGDQQQIDGGAERWITIQSILESVKNYAADISDRFPEETCFKRSEQKSAFPQYRLQSNQSYPLLCEMIAKDWLSKRNYRQNDKDNILSFILHPNLSGDHLITQFPAHEIQLFLIVRGLLSSEILLIALKKRHRVNYGINPNPSFHRFMAVPFRAKDVAADRTEFGHPDVALVLTQLSYYYSGLTDLQLKQCFDRLSKRESDPATIYEQWIRYEDKDRIPSSIIHWNGVNLEDYHQRTEHIFPTFRYHMLVVNYFLNHFVFPREAKQFPYKIISSAWDLSSSIRSKPITGFSGTNDTQLLLPIHIRQHELSELQKTDAIVVNNLLQNENERYHVLPMNAISNDILQQICDYKERIHVILDVGALFVDKTNRDIAVHWLNLSDKHQIDYAVYFDFDSIVVCDRQYQHQRFETSPASERLDHCIFYLDEIHTRGTDFKFPKRFRAAVTLGNGLTKDRFVQACMRMRQLGHGHSLTFWSSNEVHQQMTALKRQLSSNQQSYVIDILRWVYQNTIHSTWEGLYYWAEQSLSFQRKLSASQKIQWESDQQNLSNTIMKEFAEQCLEPEITELKSMYGTSKDLYTLRNIYLTRYQQSKYHVLLEIHTAVLQRLQEYGGSKQRLSQLLDEEQQRELEQELEEERQLARPLSVKPADPILHKEIKMLCNQRIDELNLDQLREVFQPISYAFNDTKFYHGCQPETWQKTLWVTTEFQRVISTTGEILDPFLRPPRWIIVYRNKHIIFVSPFEANWLIGQLRFNNVSTTTLRLLLPRIKREQGIFVDTPTLMIPRSVERSDESNVYCIPIAWLAQLFVFNGTLYFKSTNEQIAYCQYLSLCPRPRTVEEEEAFQQGWIAVDGFVRDSIHRRLLKLQDARFISNPLMFIKQLIENRNNSYIPVASHVGSIIFNSQKLL